MTPPVNEKRPQHYEQINTHAIFTVVISFKWLTDFTNYCLYQHETYTIDTLFKVKVITIQESNQLLIL